MTLCVCKTPAAESIRIPGVPTLCHACQKKLEDAYPLIKALVHVSMFEENVLEILQAEQRKGVK